MLPRRTSPPQVYPWDLVSRTQGLRASQRKYINRWKGIEFCRVRCFEAVGQGTVLPVFPLQVCVAWVALGDGLVGCAVVGEEDLQGKDME